MAFVSEPAARCITEFIGPPAWAIVYADAGFVTISAAVLLAPLDDVDTSRPSTVEWRAAARATATRN